MSFRQIVFHDPFEPWALFYSPVRVVLCDLFSFFDISRDFRIHIFEVAVVHCETGAVDLMIEVVRAI
jgi:hypothetical protein